MTVGGRKCIAIGSTLRSGHAHKSAIHAPTRAYFIRNTLATMKYGGKYGGPNQTGARNSWHFATKFHRDESNFVACCHEIPRARLVMLGGRLMILDRIWINDASRMAFVVRERVPGA
jgi:hypothetical protein